MIRSAIYSAIICIALCASQATAQISYLDIEPDIRIEGWEVYGLSLASDQSTVLDIWKHPNEVVINTHSSNVQVLYVGDYPVCVEAGTPISSTGTWKRPSYDVLNNEGTSGNWINVTNRYLGIRYRMGGSWFYGWARMDIDQAPTHFTLKDYAAELAPNTPIEAGVASSASVNEMGDDMYWTLHGQQLTVHEPCEIELISPLGVKVMSSRHNSGETLDLRGAGAGMYLLTIKGKHYVHTEKIVIR